MREFITGAPVLVVAALLLIWAGISGEGSVRDVAGLTGIVLLSAWSGAYLRGWEWERKESDG